MANTQLICYLARTQTNKMLINSIFRLVKFLVVLTEKVGKMFIHRHITSKKAWNIYVLQINRHWALGVLLLLNNVTTVF